MKTRIKNQDAHPGLAVPRQVRRSGEEMKAAREKKKQDEVEAEKRQTEKIAGLANIESSIKKKHRQAQDSATKPPASKTITKVPRMVSTSALSASYIPKFSMTRRL